MNLTLPEMPGLVEWLIDASVQSSVLVLIVLLGQCVFRRWLTPGWRHALWWIVLGRLLIPVAPPSGWSLFNLVPQGLFRERAAVVSNPAGGASMNGGRDVAGIETGLPSPPLPISIPTMEASVRVVSGFRFSGAGTEKAIGTTSNSERWPSVGAGLAWVWVVGACVAWGAQIRRRLGFSRRIRRMMRPASPELVGLLESCRVQMGVRRRVELLCGQAVVSPAVYGIWRPRLLLPTQVADECRSEALRLIFLHELAHVRRGDLWVHGLTRVFRVLHWFNPLLAWAFGRMRADREMATDALVLEVAGESESRAYGLTIVGMLERLAVRSCPDGAVGILEDNASLERRIRAIAVYRRPSRWAGLASVPLVLLALASWTGAQPAVVPVRAEVKAALVRPTEGSEAPVIQRRFREAEARPETPPSEEGQGQAQKQGQRRVDPNPGLDLVYQNPFAVSTGDGAPSEGRQRIVEILESTRIPEVRFDRLPLEVAVRELKALAEAHAAGGKGVNFYMNPYLDSQPPGVPVVDPNTGLEIVAPTSEPVPLSDVIVRIDPPLRDVRLVDVLRAMVASASVPIDYVIEEYAVVLCHNRPKRATLVTRVYRVDAEKVRLGLEQTDPVLVALGPADSGGGVSSTNAQETLRTFLVGLGIRLSPPSAVYFNDTRGLLMVRLPVEEMEIVEQAVEMLNAPGATNAAAGLPASPGGSAVDRSGVKAAQWDEYAEAVNELAALFAKGREDAPEFRHAQARVRRLHLQLGLDEGAPPSGTPAEKPASSPDQVVLLSDGRWTTHGEEVSGGDREQRLRWPGDPRVPWRTLANQLSPSNNLPVPVLIAFEADWSLDSKQTRKSVLESASVQELFRSVGALLYRVDCTRDDGSLEAMKRLYGVSSVPAYVVYHPARKVWTLAELPITARSLSRLLQPDPKR